MAHCGFDSAFDGGSPGDDDASLPDARPSEGGPDAQADRVAPPPRGLVAIQVVTGDSHSCAIDPTGQVYCWGSNEYGQLGLPLDVGAVSIPRLVDLPAGTRATQLAAGGHHTCAVTDRDGLLCWGRNDAGQLARPPSAVAPPDAIVPPSALATVDFVAVSAGRAHTCAIYKQPEVGDAGEADAGPPVYRLACWGDNASLQLARDDVSATEVPTDVRRGANAVVAGPKSLVFDGVSLGDDFSVASLRVGETYRVQAWGSASHGELATDPDAGNRAVPASVFLEDGGALENVVAFHAGATHSCATILVASSQDAGAADADVPDVDVPDAPFDEDAGAQDAGDDASVRGDLQVVCWGANESGQLARDAATGHELPAVTSSVQGSDSTLVVGGRVTCILDAAKLRCAGANEEGQLGIGAADDGPHALFEPVHGLDLPVVKASLGARHACALLQTIPGIAQVACWGDNTLGQLGDGVALGGGYEDAAPTERHRRALPVFVAPPD